MNFESTLAILCVEIVDGVSSGLVQQLGEFGTLFWWWFRNYRIDDDGRIDRIDDNGRIDDRIDDDGRIDDDIAGILSVFDPGSFVGETHIGIRVIVAGRWLYVHFI